MAISKPIAVRLPLDVERRLSRLAEETGRSASFYVRELLLEHIDDLEDRFWEDRVVREWESSDKKTRPAEELWAELGI